MLTRRTLLEGAAAMTIAGSATEASGAPTGSPGRRPGDPVRVGIIGLEGHVSEITDAAAEVPGLSVVAVAEGDPALAERARRSPVYRQATFYKEFQALLGRETLDIAAVCGETGGRAEVLLACAARKLPIVSEKPLTRTLEELRAVRTAVARSRVPLTMLLPMRFSPHYRAMREIVRSGEVGDVVGMDAQKSYKLGERPDWMKHRERFGGTIPFVGIHMIDLMLWIGGRELTEVSAFHGNVGFPEIGEMENTAAVLFRTDSGGTASLRIDYLRPSTAPTHGDDRLRITGSKGVVEYQESTGLTLMTRSEKPRVVTDLPPQGSLFADFVESLDQRKPHVIRPEEVFRATEVALKARDAADRGRMLRL
jgi:predicted dehydrogenase